MSETKFESIPVEKKEGKKLDPKLEELRLLYEGQPRPAGQKIEDRVAFLRKRRARVMMLKGSMTKEDKERFDADMEELKTLEDSPEYEPIKTREQLEAKEKKVRDANAIRFQEETKAKLRRIRQDLGTERINPVHTESPAAPEIHGAEPYKGLEGKYQRGRQKTEIIPKPSLWQRTKGFFGIK